MGIEAPGTVRFRHRGSIVLVSLLATFAGVALIIDQPEGTPLPWLAVPLLAIGGACLTWTVWPKSHVPGEAPNSLAAKLLRRVTLNCRLIPTFPAVGVGIILADLAYNITLSATPAVQSEDTMVLLAASALLVYRFVPGRFARERDFVLLFFMGLNAILVVPLLLARAYYADFERSVDLYSWVALAPEASLVLSLLGVVNTVHSVSASTAPGLTFTPLHVPLQVTVVITTACSGIYSFGIFASAFVAFVLTEYERLSPRVWLLLALGLITAYVANVLRMVIIILIGYYTDSAETDLQNMLVAHSYAGWLIFMGWIGLFWGVTMKALPKQTEPQREGSLPQRPRSLCGICNRALTPSIPAGRCGCGAIHHENCLTMEGRCPSCGAPSRGQDNQNPPVRA